MLRNRIYYQVKPFIPQPLRSAVRRRLALRLQERVGDVWPIMPGSQRIPDRWTGWPESKQFAVVLTHDVEGPSGLSRCRQLMQVEQEMGFRSSFNFIPAGGYQVAAELRAELTTNGFEVGVHDLNHDGRLYRTRREFVEKAKLINGYLRDWGVAGFRSGFMLHNLDWLHDLEIQYDASTFDTDPFEPQPEGRHTIFPFWIPSVNPGTGSHREGYVELPYTLPQDSTLFLVLRERTPEIWLRKLDWVAQNGGMALLNVHPDYVQFEGEPPSPRKYPVAHYRQLLGYIRETYAGKFWQALPREVATYVGARERRPYIRRSKRICMVTHSFYDSDNRVTRYAQALAQRGDHVDVVALRGSPESPRHERVDGVNIYRIKDRFGKTERSKLAYLLPLLRFLRSSGTWLTRSHSRCRYDLLHIHNVPDFIVFAGWYPKLTGARVILDIHDIVPEFYASKFRIPHKGLIFTLLGWMERASARFADHVIVANHLWLDKYAARTDTTGRCTAFINNVDSTLFMPRRQESANGKQIVLFPGGLQWHQGVDIAIRAFQQVRAELPHTEFHIYGDGSAKESLVSLTRELDLDESVKFFTPRSVREIASVMARADLGVVPKRADSFGNEAYSTKIMEFMAVGVPVIVSSTKVDRFYFDDSIVRFFSSGDVDALAREMVDLLRNADVRRGLITRAAEYAARNSWESRKADYLALVDSLCRSGNGVPLPAALSKAA